MIVRDEEHNLGRCLDSVAGLFDITIIVDTGSTDGTKEIASRSGAKVYDFRWVDDFAAARNFAFSKAQTDYVMWLDADDVVVPPERQKLLELKKKLSERGPDVYSMVYNYAQDEYGRSVCSIRNHRIIKNHLGIAWRWPIHECLVFPPGLPVNIENLDVEITHVRSAEDYVADLGRNLRIMEKAVAAEPTEPRLIYYYGRELHFTGRHGEAIATFNRYVGGRDTWHDDVVNAYYLLALSSLAVSNESGAIDACLAAIRLDARWAEFYNTIGQTHYDHGRWNQAIPWFEISRTLKRPDVSGVVLDDHYGWIPHDRLCKCYSEIGRVQEAYESNEAALKFRPSDGRLLHNRSCLRNALFPGRTAQRPIRLSLGSGGKHTFGYRCTDLYPGRNVSEVFDQSELPYEPGSVHAIYSEHALEHCAGHLAAGETVAGWARALRHGGSLVVKVPDLEACCKKFLESSDEKPVDWPWTARDWYKYTIYGIQKSQSGEPDSGQYHRTGFTIHNLGTLLQENGFEVNSLERYDGYGTPSIKAVATQIGQKMKVVWLIGVPDEDHGSIRIRRLNVHRWMLENDIDSTIVDPAADGSLDACKRADVCVFSSLGTTEYKLADALRRFGVACVYDHCEDLTGLDMQAECFGLMDTVVCCSTALADKTVGVYGVRTAVIPDAYEVGESSSRSSGRACTVINCCMGGNAANGDFLRPIIERLGMKYLVISEWDCHDIKWHRDTWLAELSKADIVVCPQRHILQPAKSNNRVTQAQSLGIPVCASPLQSYLEAIEHGVTGYVCSTVEEWEWCLGILCGSAKLRLKVGEAGRLSAQQKYSTDVVGKSWKDLLDSLSRESCAGPMVDIIIPTWNNLLYLKECIKSIRANTDWPHRVIVVNSGSDDTTRWLTEENPDIVYHNHQTRLHFSAANNVGLSLSKSPYVCLLNDDTIVSEFWLSALMREAMRPGVGAVNPFSNCDMGWLHDELVAVDGVDLRPGMTHDQIVGIIPSLYKMRHEKRVTVRGWLPFYCTVMPRQAIDRVGPLDENFKSGCEDLDYCLRMKKLGYKFVTTDDAFVFHFGGSTRKKAEGVDQALHQHEDVANHALLQRKYSPTKKRILIYTGAGWEKWSPDSVNGGGIGGSETCTVHVAREFARRGYEVIVVGDPPNPGVFDGVRYESWAGFDHNIESDIFISSRRPDIFSTAARKNVCLVHDIWLNSDGGAGINVDKFDKFFVLSPWHKEFFCRHHSVPDDKVFVTRDAIDHSRFNKHLPRVPGRMIYSSSPDRGLDVLLDCLPRIRQRVPHAHLKVFYGFDNWEKAVEVRGNPHEIGWMKRIKQQLNQPGVEYVGRVGQDRLADEFLQAELWGYPTAFWETFCITAVEAMAAGVPVVTSNLAALSTTVGIDGGVIIDGDNKSEAYQNAFVEVCVYILSNPDVWSELSQRGKAKAAGYRWDTLVDEWFAELS